MAVTSVRMAAGVQLSDSLSTLYTVGTGTVSRIEAATITNTSGSAETFSLYLVPAGLSAAAETQIIKDKSIAAGGTYRCAELVNQILTAGDSIQAVASAASALTVYISGSEKTDA